MFALNSCGVTSARQGGWEARIAATVSGCQREGLVRVWRASICEGTIRADAVRRAGRSRGRVRGRGEEVEPILRRVEEGIAARSSSGTESLEVERYFL